jgi:hypothetical protein
MLGLPPFVAELPNSMPDLPKSRANLSLVKMHGEKSFTVVSYVRVYRNNERGNLYARYLAKPNLAP